MNELKSAREWDVELQTHIVDWDGFENRDPSAVMPREEFERRAASSTRMIRLPELPPEDEGTTEGAHESLSTWLNPIHQQMGAVTQGSPPEISPAAREAAFQEIQNNSPITTGYYVQRAIDAAVAEERTMYNLLHGPVPPSAARQVVERDAAIARLTKELAEARDSTRFVLSETNAERTELLQKLAQAEASIAAQQKKHESHLAVVDRQWKSLCDIEAIRRANKERDEADIRDALAAEKLSVASLTNERDILQRMLAAAEKRCRELSQWVSDKRRVCDLDNLLQERDTLAQRVAELEQDHCRDEQMRVIAENAERRIRVRPPTPPPELETNF